MLQESVGRTRLLAVDDSADSADLVARVAAKCGYETQATSDPASVRTLVQNWKPEILTLDLCMPETDGIDLLSVLEDAGFKGRLIIISGQDSWFRKAARRLAETHGLAVIEDLRKPVDIAALRQLLNRLQQASQNG
jgi:DNA-binding NtrC family response regulator